MYEINRFRRLSQTLVHFVIDRASLFTDHRISGRPIRVKYKHFRTIWEHTSDNSPTDSNSFSLKWWSSMHGVDTLWSCCVDLLANSQKRSTYFLTWASMSQDYEEIRRFWGNGSFSAPPRKFALRTWFCNCPQYLCLFDIVVECIPSRHDPGKMLDSPKSTSLSSNFHIGSMFFLSSVFYVIHKRS